MPCQIVKIGGLEGPKETKKVEKPWENPPYGCFSRIASAGGVSDSTAYVKKRAQLL
jgi:hypothetical protein